MSEPLTESDLRQKLIDACRAEGSQRAWAEKHGVSPQFVNDVTKGRRNVTERIAEQLGYRVETLFYPVEKE